MSKRIFANCRIYTLSDDLPLAEAVVVEDGVIVYVGSAEDAAEFAGAGVECVDLGGRTVVPGFIDAHCHLAGFGASARAGADLSGCTSIPEVIERLRASARPGAWVIGSGFDQEILAERRYPTRQELDCVSASDPVAIVRVCGHACVVNSHALGVIDSELAQDDSHTGLLTEQDAGRMWSCMPPVEGWEVRSVILANAARALSKGVTSAHFIAGDFSDLTEVFALRDTGELPVRIHAILPFKYWPKVAGELKRMGDDWLSFGTVKIFIDGSLGARSAALNLPYDDDPSTRGELLTNSQKLVELLSAAHRAGIQFAFHAIGDRAVGEVLETLRELGHRFGVSNDYTRHRIEHASLLDADLIAGMSRLKIVACVQPQFVVSDFWAIDRLGPDRIGMYHPFGSMLEHKIPMALGSDFPVEPIDPLQAIHRAVNRDSHTPQETISVADAVRACCLGGAYASFQEDRKGCIEVGKLADFAVLSDDIFEIDPEGIETVQVLMTVVNGQVAHQTPDI